MNVAIIPARGGSKRIPGKNVKAFAGKPMIEYSIMAAAKTGLFDRIIVSTDSEEIAHVAQEAGAEVPFMRPAHLADDFTPTDHVLKHALGWLSEQDARPVEYFCCIYATAPFIKPEYLLQGFEKVQGGASAAFSVTTFDFTIFRAVKMDEQGRLDMIWPEHTMTRSNDLPTAYHDAGQFYWYRTQDYLKAQNAWALRPSAVVLPRYLVQDIDHPEDWQVAERMMVAMEGRK